MVSERYISDAVTQNDMILMPMFRMDLWMEPVHFSIHCTVYIIHCSGNDKACCD